MFGTLSQEDPAAYQVSSWILNMKILMCTCFLLNICVIEYKKNNNLLFIASLDVQNTRQDYVV